jgi:hypothetical protein
MIDISKLTEEELIILNAQIVQRIKSIRAKRNLEQLQLFKLGDVVSFIKTDSTKVVGFVTAIRKTTISVFTETRDRWNISPSHLVHEKYPSKKLQEVLQEMLDIFLGKKVIDLSSLK